MNREGSAPSQHLDMLGEAQFLWNAKKGDSGHRAAAIVEPAQPAFNDLVFFRPTKEKRAGQLYSVSASPGHMQSLQHHHKPRGWPSLAECQNY